MRLIKGPRDVTGKCTAQKRHKTGASAVFLIVQNLLIISEVVYLLCGKGDDCEHMLSTNVSQTLSLQLQSARKLNGVKSGECGFSVVDRDYRPRFV